MPIHKKILGGEIYLPFALSKLRKLAEDAAGRGGYASRIINVDDGTRIMLEVVADQQFVTIIGAPRYEFFTSDHVMGASLASPGHAGDIAHRYVCGSLTDVSGTAIKPRYSSVFTPSDTDTWVVRDCEVGSLPSDPALLWESWQNQKFFEYAWWPGNGKKSLVTSCQAQAPGWLSTCNWHSAHTSCQISNGGSMNTDIGYDVVPAYYDASGSKVGGPLFADPWIWWRRGCVTTADNGRKFFVCSDNYGRFHVYPFKDYAPDFTTPDYKTYTPPYPGWVTVPDTASEKIANQWLWQFNKDGTKCVSLPYHSVDSEYYKYARNYTGAILPEDVSLLLHPENAILGREDTPGLTEFSIAIHAGDDETDYEATFSLLRSDYFDTSGRYIFDAGYTLKNAYTIDGVAVEEDALVTAEIECFTKAGGYQTGPTTISLIEYVDLFQMLRADMAFYVNDADMGKTELKRIPVMSGRTGSFMTITGFRAWLAGGGIGPTPSGVGTSVALAAGGSKFFYSQWPAEPDGAPLEFAAGTKDGFLYASEIRSGSLVYEIDDKIAGKSQLVGSAFGKEFYNITDDLSYSIADPSNPIMETPVPASGRSIYIYALGASINTDWGTGFNVHPVGHWSCQASASMGGNFAELRAAFDIVQVKNGARRTHKEIFNKAFKQDRDYAYYLESFSGKYLFDYGSFRTHGIWVTF